MQEQRKEFMHYLFTHKYFILILVFRFLIIFLLIWLSIKPQNFILIGIISLIAFIDNNIFTSGNYINIILYALFISTFLIRGWFNTYKILKYGFSILLYIIELLPSFFVHNEDYLSIFLTKIAFSILTLAVIFFFSEYAKQTGIKAGSGTRTLNLASFKGIERSDMFLLQDVLNNMKYKDIAQKIHGSEGALRNKLSKIYKILEVGDRTGFLTIYSGYTLIYEPEEIG